jgi:hypothetical protein
MAVPTLQPFVDPDPFQEFTYPTRVAAKLAIADYLAVPLAKLPWQNDPPPARTGRTGTGKGHSGGTVSRSR